MTKPIETLAGADATAFRNAIDPHVRAIAEAHAPYIWRKMPSLESGGAAGTPAETIARLQAKADALQAQGGGILFLNETQLDIDRPLLMRPKVSVIGPSSGFALLRNVYAGYNANSSACLAPGNLHPTYTQNLYGDAGSKAISAAISGDGAVTLVTAGDAAGFAVGSLIAILSAEYYAAGGGNIAKYMALRRITRISGALLYLDEPLFDALPTGGIVHNLDTTTVQGDATYAGGPTAPLWAWGDGEIAGFACETIGNWISPASGAYKGRIHDMRVRSRRIWYVNAFQHCVMSNVSGGFFVKAGEASLNCENFEVRDSTATYDRALKAESDAAGVSVAGAPFGGFSMQENTHYTRWRNLIVNLTGCPAGAAVSINNSEHNAIENVRIANYDAANASDVLAIGNLVVAANRREARFNTIRGLEWDGYCGRYLAMVNAATDGNSIDMRARGPVTTAVSVNIADCTGRNVIEPTCFFENGRLDLTGTAANLECVGAYIGGGLTALTTNNFSELETNNIRGVRTSMSAARRAGDTILPAAVTHTGTAANTTILSKSIGTATIRAQDRISWEARMNVSGTAGIKSIYARIRNETDGIDYSLAGFNIPAATTGVITLKADMIATTTGQMFGSGQCNNSGVTITPGAITSDMAAKQLSIKLDIQLVNATDSVTINMVRLDIDNEVQN